MLTCEPLTLRWAPRPLQTKFNRASILHSGRGR